MACANWMFRGDLIYGWPLVQFNLDSNQKQEKQKL